MGEKCEDREEIKKIVKKIAEEVNKTRGTKGNVFYSDIINHVTKTPEKFPEFADILRLCLQNLKKGEIIV